MTLGKLADEAHGNRRVGEHSRRVSYRVGRGGIASAVTEVANDFQNFTAGGKHTTARAFISFDRIHEFQFLGGVFTFAGRGVNLSTTLDFSSRFEGRFGGGFFGDRLGATLCLSPIDRHNTFAITFDS